MHDSICLWDVIPMRKMGFGAWVGSSWFDGLVVSKSLQGSWHLQRIMTWVLCSSQSVKVSELLHGLRCYVSLLAWHCRVGRAVKWLGCELSIVIEGWEKTSLVLVCWVPSIVFLLRGVGYWIYYMDTKFITFPYTMRYVGYYWAVWSESSVIMKTLVRWHLFTLSYLNTVYNSNTNVMVRNAKELSEISGRPTLYPSMHHVCIPVGK